MGKQDRHRGITRRKFIKMVGAAGIAAAGASLLPRLSQAAARGYILIGHPTPATGPIAPFGETSAWTTCGPWRKLTRMAASSLRSWVRNYQSELKRWIRKAIPPRLPT